MKNWFKNLKPQSRKTTLIILWVITSTLFLVIGSVPENSSISNVLVWLWIAALIFSIIFSVWASKFKKAEKSENSTEIRTNTKSATTPITERKPINSTSQTHVAPVSTTNDERRCASMQTVKFFYPNNKTFFFVDVETATRSNDTVCAIGAIIIKNGMETSFYTLINPKTHITNTSIHGIDDEDVIDAPTLEEYWPTIAKEIGNDYIIIGHNVAFDISVLNKNLEKYGIDFCPTRKVDTMAVAKDILYHFFTQSGDLKLDTICKRLNIKLHHHNAESDISATKQVLETLLTMGNRNITDFINMHYSSAKDSAIGNVRKVSVQRYWDDIYAGRTPVYFTNWNNTSYDTTPEYDTIELEVLQFSSMMDRANSDIIRIAKQVELIKSCVESICGKIYGKGAKKAKCYIEFYYMDVAEYIKLKGLGYKIYHAIDVENFITENQELIQNYAVKQAEAAAYAAAEKEKLIRERNERRAQREARKLEPKEPSKRITRKVVQLNDEGEIITIFESLSDAVKATGTNSKSIRDCCNRIQKHAGGFIWKYSDDDVVDNSTES